MAKYMETLFDNVEKITQDKGYWILKSVKQKNERVLKDDIVPDDKKGTEPQEAFPHLTESVAK